MTSQETLTSRLAAVLSPETVLPDGWRRIETGKADVLPAAVAVEIDQTLFPRHLVLRNKSGQTVTLDVAARRLRRLVGDVPAGLAEWAALFGADIGPDRPDTIADLADLLRALADGAGEIEVLSRPALEPDGAARGGISGDALAQAWSVSASPAAAAAQFAEFCGAVATLGGRWARLDAAGETATLGPEADETCLAYWAEAVAGGPLPASSDLRPAICLLAGSQDGPALLIARLGGEHLIAEAEEPGLVWAQWQSLILGQ